MSGKRKPIEAASGTDAPTPGMTHLPSHTSNGLLSRLCVFQMESACLSIHEVLKVVSDSQTWYRLREAQDRMRAEDLHERVSFWSIGETMILFAVSIGQVLMLRSFFSDKKGSVSAST